MCNTCVVGMVQVRGKGGGGVYLILLRVLVQHSFHCGVARASINMVDFHAARSCATMCPCSGSVSLVIVEIKVRAVLAVAMVGEPNSASMDVRE